VNVVLSRCALLCQRCFFFFFPHSLCVDLVKDGLHLIMVLNRMRSNLREEYKKNISYLSIVIKHCF